MARRHELVRGAPLLPEIQSTLDAYVPRVISSEDWDRVRPKVHDWFLLASPRDRARALRLLLTLTRVALWAEGLRLPLDPNFLFSPVMVDRYCDHVGEDDETTAKDSRALLRRYGPVMGNADDWPMPPKQFARNSVSPPLSLSEETLLLKLARTLSTSHEAMCVLGFGFGLDGRWLPHITANDLEMVDDWPHLNVPDPDARQVPVLARYHDAVLELVEQVPTGPLVGGENCVQNRCWALARKLMLDDDRRLFIGEMRSTWFTAHLRNNTDLVYLSRISGRKSFQRLLELLEFVEPADPTTAARHARKA